MDFDTSRSGTAPNPPTRKMAHPGLGRREGSGLHASKPRPSTRGAGGADIADLNASLRHDRTDHNGSGYSEAVESYREAIFSWGEPEPAEDTSKQPTPRFKHPRSAYTSSTNKVRLRQSDSAALDADDSSGSAAAAPSSNISSKAANVSAIYGVPSKKAKTPSFPRRDVGKSRARPSSPATGSSSNITSSGFGTPPKRASRHVSDPAAARPGLTVSTNTGTAPKSGVTSPLSQSFGQGGRSTPNGGGGSPHYADSGTVTVRSPLAMEATALPAPSPEDLKAVGFADVAESSSSRITVDTSAVESTRSIRPQSRKLYLGASNSEAPSPSWSAGPAATRRVRQLAVDASADPFLASAASSPKLESSLSPSGASPKKSGMLLAVASGDSDSPKQSPKLSRNKSFPQVRPAPWNADECLDERPPSRQGTAFPFHLAGSDGEGDEQVGHPERKAAMAGSASTPVLFDTEDPTPPPISFSPHGLLGKSSPINIIGASVSGTSTPTIPIADSAAPPSEKRRSTLPSASNRPTTRGPGGSHAMASSPNSNYSSSAATGAFNVPTINTSEWAPVYDPVADGFSDIIPDGPPTFTIEFNNMKSGSHRRPRPVSGVEKSGVMEKKDAEIEITEASPVRTQIKSNLFGNRDRVASAKSAGSAKPYGSGGSAGSKAYPAMPSTAGGTTSSGRLQHRHVVNNQGLGKKTYDKPGQSCDLKNHSPSSEEEAYYLSSWNKSEKVSPKKAGVSHPTSAPAKKQFQSGSQARGGTAAWQTSAVSSVPFNRKRSGSSGSRLDGGPVNRQVSSAVGRTRSSSQENDLNGYGASGNYFTPMAGTTSATVNRNRNFSKPTAAGALTLSDFEDEDVCITSDDDANEILSVGDDIADDEEENTLSEDSGKHLSMNHAMSMQSINLETSLGEDFLSLFARG